MMAPMAARLGAVVILIVFGLAMPCLADAPKFSPPLDNAVLSADVTIRAVKKHLDGNDRGYISFRIVRQGDKPDKVPFVVAVVYPFEYRWNTQETYWNQADADDPLNGSRKYPDGIYTITAVAFDEAGKQLGEPATATVRVANNVPNPPLRGGKMLLETASFAGQELRYKATGSLYARLTAEEEERLELPIVPPLVQMKMEANWRVNVLKPLSPAETADGRRWHGQFYPQAILGPDGRVIMTRWDNVRYAVQDEHIEDGWVELVGGASREQYKAWLASGMSLGSIGATILDLPGTGGAVAGAGAAGAPGAVPGAPAQGGAVSGGPGAGAMPGGEQPAGAEGAPGAAAAAAAGGGGAGLRGQYLMPVNLPGLGRRFRSILLANGSVGKMRREDPRWPLAELWIQLPSHPVGVGDTWTGDMTLLPFFDEQLHMHAHGGGGFAAWGPHHLDPLYNRYYSGQAEGSTNEGYGPANAPVIHILDGFEYYKGYECARIVSRFRNYQDPEAWRRDYKTGWWLADLNPRIFGMYQGAGSYADTVPMVRTDLIRVTYFAYRSGHVVGIEDHYRHQLWLNRAGFLSLAATRRYQRNLPGYEALLALAGPLGLPGAVMPGAGVGAAGTGEGALQPGVGVPMPGGEAAAMPGAPGGMGGGAAASTGRPGWDLDTKRSLFYAPAGGGAAAAGVMGAPGGGQPGMEGMGGEPGAAGPMAGAMGPMLGGMGAVPGVAGEGAPGAGAGAPQAETMCDAVAQVVITILEQGGSDERNARPRIEYAAMPPAGQAATPPGAALNTRSQVRRYVVVESARMFYDPSSPLLVNQRGVTVDTSADRLIALGYRPAPDLQF